MSQTPHQAPPPQAVRALPVMDTVAATYARFGRQVRFLPRALCLPTLFYLVAPPLLAVVVPTAPAGMGEFSSGAYFAFFVFWLLSLAVYSVFGIHWLRLTLLGPTAVPPFFPGWGRREWRVYGYIFANIGIALLAVILAGIVLFLIITVIGLVYDAASGTATTLLPLLNMPLALLASLLAVLRFGFVFPALAVDESYSLALSWRHTKGQSLRLLAAALLTGLPLVIAVLMSYGLITLLTGVPLAMAPGPETAASGLTLGLIVAAVVNVLVGLGCAAVGFTFVAVAFETCTGWVPHAPLPGLRAQGDAPSAMD